MVSAGAIHERFLGYRTNGDFVGMDVARKYLQMGYTKAWRYARYAGGNKSKPLEEPDPKKSRAAGVFYEKWRHRRGRGVPEAQGGAQASR